MSYPEIFIVGFLSLGSAYYLMHSLAEARKKQQLFYRDVLPELNEATTRRSTPLPILTGKMGNQKIMIVPEVDNLSLYRLPRLYIRLYLMGSNDTQCRIIKVNENHRFFPRARFEKYYLYTDGSASDYKICLPRETKAGKPLTKALASSLSEMEGCSEVLIQNNFIRATLFVVKAEKNYYKILRAVRFPILTLKREQLFNTIGLLQKLGKEVSRLENS